MVGTQLQKEDGKGWREDATQKRINLNPKNWINSQEFPDHSADAYLDWKNHLDALVENKNSKAQDMLIHYNRKEIATIAKKEAIKIIKLRRPCKSNRSLSKFLGRIAYLFMDKLNFPPYFYVLCLC